MLALTVTLAGFGVTAMEDRVGGGADVTLTVALPLIGLMVAVTVSLPALLPVTMPDELTLVWPPVLVHAGLTHPPVEESL